MDTEQVDKIGRTDKIWIANRASTWDVLRVSETNINIIAIEQNVEPQITFTTDGNHKFVKDYLQYPGEVDLSAYVNF